MGKVAETAVWIRKETKETLKKIGRKDETYDDLIRRLIREAGYHEVLQELEL